MITQLPPGQHYDQLRFILNPEQQLLGIVENVSIRQIVANIILLAYPAVYVVEYLRFIGATTLLPLVPKIVSSLFFILSLFVWKNILKRLDMSIGAGWFFLFLVVLSPWYLVFGKYLPLLGGFLFYSSLCWYFFILWIQNKKFLNLVVSSFFLVLTTFTHIFSVILLPLSLLIFTVLSVKRGFLSMRQVLSGGIGSLVVLVVSIGVILYLIGVQGSQEAQLADNSLSGKDTSTILYQISQGEISSASQAYVQRLLYYLHPGFLVVGGKLVDSSSGDTSFQFSDIKNPEFNHWQISGVGPFGFVALLIYFLPIFVRIPKSHGGNFFWALFIPYVLGAGFSNFDNPSIARFIPFILWIPYVITLYLDTVVRAGLEFKKNLLIYMSIVGVAVISAGFTLSYLYSPAYQEAESKKFELVYDDVFEYINNNISAAPDVYFFQDNRWNSHSYLEYYLSPLILSKTVLVPNSEFLEKYLTENPDFRFVFIFKEEAYRAVFSNKQNIIVAEVTDLPSGSRQFIAYSSNLQRAGNDKYCYEIAQTSLSRLSLEPSVFLGEEEFLTLGYVPSYVGKLYSLDLSSKEPNEWMHSPIIARPIILSLSPVGRQNSFLTEKGELMKPGATPAIIDYAFVVTDEGLYEVQVELQYQGGATAEIFLRKGDQRLPMKKLINNDGKYSSPIYLQMEQEYVISIVSYAFAPVKLNNPPTPELSVLSFSLNYIGGAEKKDFIPFTPSQKIRIGPSFRIRNPTQNSFLVCEALYSPSVIASGGEITGWTLGNLVGISNKGSEEIRLSTFAHFTAVVLICVYVLSGGGFYLLLRSLSRIFR